jgi:uncharacterized DUF497 family protein
MRQFEWDDKKAEVNWRKHGITFEDAKHVFDDPSHVSIPDNRFEYSEERWQTLGMIGDNFLLLFVAHTIDENGIEVIKIISARRANRKERKRYGNSKI